jgi:hypothetical protein
MDPFGAQPGESARVRVDMLQTTDQVFEHIADRNGLGNTRNPAGCHHKMIVIANDHWIVFRDMPLGGLMRVGISPAGGRSSQRPCHIVWCGALCRDHHGNTATVQQTIVLDDCEYQNLCFCGLNCDIATGLALHSLCASLPGYIHRSGVSSIRTDIFHQMKVLVDLFGVPVGFADFLNIHGSNHMPKMGPC